MDKDITDITIKAQGHETGMKIELVQVTEKQIEIFVTDSIPDVLVTTGPVKDNGVFKNSFNEMMNIYYTIILIHNKIVRVKLGV